MIYSIILYDTLYLCVCQYKLLYIIRRRRSRAGMVFRPRLAEQAPIHARAGECARPSLGGLLRRAF